MYRSVVALKYVFKVKRTIQCMYGSPTRFRWGINHQHSAVVPGGGLEKIGDMEVTGAWLGDNTVFVLAGSLESAAPFAVSVNGGNPTSSSVCFAGICSCSAFQASSCSVRAVSSSCCSTVKPFSSTVCAAGTICVRKRLFSTFLQIFPCDANLDTRQTDSSSRSLRTALGIHPCGGGTGEVW